MFELNSRIKYIADADKSIKWRKQVCIYSMQWYLALRLFLGEGMIFVIHKYVVRLFNWDYTDT